MIALKLSKLIAIVGGKIRQQNVDEAEVVSGFSIDSRTLNKNEVFIAIVGDNFDGNNYIDEVIEKGSPWIISSAKNHKNDQCIYVENTREALSKIAAHFIGIVAPKVIAITGSNGKTTTKEMVAKILFQKYSKSEVLVTKGNFNNDIGLPLTLFNLNQNHKIVVLEMGMNHEGEIIKLCEIAPPDIAVITNIGEAHIENFSSKDAIAKAKKEILIGAKSDAIAVLPQDDSYLSYLRSGLLLQKFISFGTHEHSDIRVELTKTALTIYGESVNIKATLLGKENLINMAAAVAVATALGISKDCVIKAFKDFSPIPGRLEIKKIDRNITIIDDSYNSNPSSMIMAIDVLNEHKLKKILIVGDMAELGPLSKKYHINMGHYILGKKIDLVLGIGNMTKHLIDVIGTKGFWYTSKETLLRDLKKKLQKDSVVLVKGSRVMQMEKIVNALEEQE